DAIARLPEIFSTRPDRDEQESARRESALYEEIGRLKVELDWLKKNSRNRSRRYLLTGDWPSAYHTA
ncbi:MAG: hypothetical protein KJ698_13875, partial [Actinobacteria bacterium]|nr:hypothetical protein [Actinomycetota bacterium]